MRIKDHFRGQALGALLAHAAIVPVNYIFQPPGFLSPLNPGVEQMDQAQLLVESERAFYPMDFTLWPDVKMWLCEFFSTHPGVNSPSPSKFIEVKRKRVKTEL